MDMLNVINELMKNLPPLAAALLLFAGGVVFIIGFGRHGINFIKYGFKQTALDSSLEKRFDQFEAKFDTRFAQIDDRFTQIDDRFTQMDDRFVKTELTSILVDRQVINLQDKARLDNKLRGM
ncbi:MAG: hypothetical protein LBK61_04155 [Spirochaetaceae bacterium]|jgi:hypothetical protein|nr:hypothetical protein [Spirochaetaceae bacterium]